MTKANTDARNRRTYIVPAILFVFGLYLSFTLISSIVLIVLSGAYISLLDVLVPFIVVLATFGLGLLCYTGLRSGKKIRDLPRGIVWFGWASMVVMILGVLESILIFLMTSPLFMSK